MTIPFYCQTAPAGRNPLGRRGCISTPHYLASQAGLHILRRGGTAVDAAIAATAVLSVVYPHMCGLGGDSFWLMYDARAGRLHALNASGRAAALATPELYYRRGLKAIPSRGPLAAITVPGAVSGWNAAFTLSRKQLGSVLGWDTLLADAIHYACDGFAVSQSLAQWLDMDWSDLKGLPGFAALFASVSDSCPKETCTALPGADARLCLPHLGRTLELLAREGADAFYHGSIAQAIDACMREHDAPLRAADLATHTVRWDEPLCIPYRDTVAASTPPCSQGMSALQILNICNQFDVAGMGEGSADWYHLMAEAVRLAFADRNRWLTDPDHSAIPLHRLLSPDYGQEQARRIRPDQCLAMPGGLRPGGDTVWVGVVDAAGNAVSMLQSIYHEFGSGVVAGETGILLQNRGCAFSLEPAHVNSLVPGKRTLHTLTPAMLLRQGKPWLVYGSMGGDGQPQTLAALASRVLDFGLSPQEAVTAPRWLLGRSWGAQDSDLKLEGRITPAVVAELRRRGHPVRLLADFTELMGHAGAILCREDGSLQGAADPRGDGQALAF